MLKPKDMFRIDYGSDEHSHKIFKKEDENNETKSYIVKRKKLTPELYNIAKVKHRDSLVHNPHLTADQFHEIAETKYASNRQQIQTLINDPKKRKFRYNSIAAIDPRIDVVKQIKEMPDNLKNFLATPDNGHNPKSFSYKVNFNDLMALHSQVERDVYLRHMDVSPYGNEEASLILATKFASDNSAHHIHDKLLNSRYSSKDKVPVIHELMFNPNISKENKKIIYDKESNSHNPIPNLSQYERFVK